MKPFFPTFPKTFDSSDIHYIRTLFNNFNPLPLFSLSQNLKKKYLFISWLEYVICLLVTCPMFSMQVMKTMLILKLLWNKHISINESITILLNHLLSIIFTILYINPYSAACPFIFAWPWHVLRQSVCHRYLFFGLL